MSKDYSCATDFQSCLLPPARRANSPLVSPQARINEEKQVVDVLYISGHFAPYDLHSRYKYTYKIIKGIKRFSPETVGALGGMLGDGVV